MGQGTGASGGGGTVGGQATQSNQGMSDFLSSILSGIGMPNFNLPNLGGNAGQLNPLTTTSATPTFPNPVPPPVGAPPANSLNPLALQGNPFASSFPFVDPNPPPGGTGGAGGGATGAGGGPGGVAPPATIPGGVPLSQIPWASRQFPNAPGTDILGPGGGLFAQSGAADIANMNRFAPADYVIPFSNLKYP